MDRIVVAADLLGLLFHGGPAGDGMSDLGVDNDHDTGSKSAF